MTIETPVVQYIALPEDERNKAWESISPRYRYLEQKSPLGKIGWLSFYSEEHKAFILMANKDGSVPSGMLTDAETHGVHVKAGK